MSTSSYMTVAVARARAQALINEPGSTSISTAQWLIFANQAQGEVFRKIVHVNPDQWTAQTMVTFPASTGSISLTGSSYLNTDVYRIVGIEAYQTATPTAGVDRPFRLKNVPFAELHNWLQGGINYADPGGMTSPLVYSTTGHTTSLKLYVAPVPITASYLLVFTVEGPPALTSDSSTISVPVEYADAVVFRMGELASIRQGGRNRAISEAYQAALADIAQTAGPKVDDEPRQMHVYGDREWY